VGRPEKNMTERSRFRSRAASAPLAAAATLAVAEAAGATPIDETTDFGDSFAESTLLPLGTDVVNGAIFDFEGDADDFVTFHGLTPGAAFDLSVTGNTMGAELNTTQYDDMGASVQSGVGSGLFMQGTVPASGLLNFGLNVQDGGVFYTLTLVVPEPGAAALLGGGLLAAAALRRVRARRGT
jgi:hypothetical protein